MHKWILQVKSIFGIVPFKFCQVNLITPLCNNEEQNDLVYCKSGNIRGTLIFANFAEIQQARIQKPAKIFTLFCMYILDT